MWSATLGDDVMALLTDTIMDGPKQYRSILKNLLELQVNTLNHYRVSYLSVPFGGPERTVFQINMPAVPREKYLEMD